MSIGPAAILLIVYYKLQFFQQAAMLLDVASELQFHSPMVSAAGGSVTSVDYDARL